VVPRSALFRGANNDWQVFTIERGRAHLRNVKVGLSNDERAEITSGLNEGDQVILAPEVNLSEGQRVRVLDTGAGAAS
jgi:HlyD family secretion protein